MLANYLKVTLRTLRRYKGHTFINVAGLAVGMAACLLIFLYVQDELRFDAYHAHADRVYRVTHEQRSADGSSSVHRVLIDPPVAPLLKEAFPEVTHAARLTPVGPLLSNGDRHVDSGHCYWADNDLFRILSFSFVGGDPGRALVEPFSLVLSASKARALFGDEDPVGRTVVVNNRDPFTVTGVFADLPPNTHLPIDVLGSISTMERWFGDPFGWDSPNYATYVRLAEGASAGQLAAKLPDFLNDHRGDEAARADRLHLQPLTGIHLHSHLVGELAPNGDFRYVVLLSVIGAFILAIACINFVNLTTARSSRRAKEVGMRKVAGARRADLVRQFLGESLVLAFLSLALAVLLVETALPFFNAFTGKALGFEGRDFFRHLAFFLAVGTLVGLAAGSYPAFYLSGFRPSTVLKGATAAGRGRSRFRSLLVVAQFTIAIVLLAGTLVVYRQLAFVRSQQLGFDTEQTVILPAIGEIAADFEPFRQRLLRHPDVLAVAQSNPVPSRRLHSSTTAARVDPRTGAQVEATLFNAWADAHFFPTYGIDFVAGRNFSDRIASDTDTGFILNETAVARLGWDAPAEAVGQPLRFGGWRGTVVGVVRDVHYESLHHAIAPMVYYMEPRNYRQVTVKARPGSDLPALIGFLEEMWQQYTPNRPLAYSFLDERFGAAYEAERRLGRIFGAFAALALVITCLGLFGMTAFTIERRTKEIGVRKVLGASVQSIVLLLSRDVGRLVAIALVVATPVAVLAMRRWLAGFAYHAALSWWTFAVVGALALLVALLTVSVQAVRAARQDPVESLRYE